MNNAHLVGDVPCFMKREETLKTCTVVEANIMVSDAVLHEGGIRGVGREGGRRDTGRGDRGM